MCVYISLFLLSLPSFPSLVSLIGVLGSTFRGFIIQARDLNGSSIGTFDVSNSNDLAQLVDCEYNNESTVSKHVHLF